MSKIHILELYKIKLCCIPNFYPVLFLFYYMVSISHVIVLQKYDFWMAK